MKTVSISGSLRENVGKKDTKSLRNQKRVPCVLYGGKEQIHFSVAEKDFKDIVYTPEVCFVNIKISEKEVNSIVQDMQFHPVTDNILHADFLELIPERKIIMKIPVKITGVAPGVLKGGKLSFKFKKIKIKALPDHMPDFITIDISKLDIGNSVKVCDLTYDNLEFLDPSNTVVVGVIVTRASATTVDATQAEGAKQA